MFFGLIRMWFVLGVVGVVGVVGCKGDDQKKDKGLQQAEQWQRFVAQYAHIYCDLRHSCDTDFDLEFGDQEECRTQVLTNENKAFECRVAEEKPSDCHVAASGVCEFNVEESETCLDALTIMSCTGWLEGEKDKVCGGNLWSCE